MKHVFLLIAAMALALLLTGCLESKQSFLLKDDGSMVVTLQYSIPTAHLPTLASCQASITSWQQRDTASDAPTWFFDEQAVRKQFARPDEGMSVLQYSKFTRNDRTNVEILIRVAHAEEAFNKGYFGSIVMKDNTLTVQCSESLESLESDLKEHIRSLCKDMTMTIEVTAPQNIVDTNGKKANSQTVTWKFTANRTPGTYDLFGKIVNLTVKW